MAIEMGIVHIGNAIEQRMRELKITQAEMAEKLKIKQPNLPRMLKKANIDTERLVTISFLLDYNFFQLWCPNNKDKDNKSFNEKNDNLKKDVPRELYDDLLKEVYEYRDTIKDLRHQISLMQKGMTVSEIAQKEVV